ncbi:hypothetical protein QOZ80_1BG0051660 [Eleusine coracana subsp. coracana]|nr:hypothetical protein QOZ80_1BG0051660 [Eleusine coracana subsp. coracana]
MKLAAAAMTPLIEKLGNVLASELTLEKSVQKDIASLERELKVMTGPELREVAEVPQDRLDEGTKLWASDVRELSYDMADAIDAFTLHVPRRGDQAAGLRSRLRGFLDKTTWLFTKGKELHQIAGAVRGAKDLAKELCEIHQRYAGLKLQDASTGASDIDPRLTAMYSEVADLVGIDGARDELIKLILFELDKQRYANINGVVRDNMKQLIDELRGFLLDKRYLIVIDDLWDEVNWKLIKCAFPKNTCRSRLITTTHISKVSEASCSSDIDIVYMMKPLSEDDSLRLFHSRIFHNDLEDCDLSKCGSHVNLRHVGKLSHLRYLGLRDTRIRELPVEVGKLQFLQTLDLRGSGDELEVPWTITGLRNLMCLRFAIDTRLPIKGLGNLTSLEELGAVTIDGDDAAAVVSELGHLTGLRVLKLLWNTEVIGEAFVQSLGNLRKLQSLNMSLSGERCDLIRSWAPPPCLRRFICNGGWISVLPEWINNNCCPSLTFLDICVSEVGAEDLKTLGTLSSLRVVRLRNLGRIDEGDRLLEVNANAFPCARNCRFINVVATPSMFPPGAMPLVQCLRFCVRAWDFAGGGGFGLDDLRMGHLPSLEKVEVDLWYREEEDDTKVVEAALRQAVEDHPNRLALDIHKWKCWRPSQA